MSVNKKLKKGFIINLKGKAQSTVVDIRPDSYALKPQDFIGFSKPKLLVEVGDNVKVGQPLYYDKSMESVMYTSPVSGEVTDIVRGEKRKLLEIRVLADKELNYLEFKKHTASEIQKTSREDVIDLLCKSGIWPSFVQRPYAVVANPQDQPKAIFVSCFDTHPLAPDFEILFKDQGDYFKTGVEILKKLTKGKVHLNLDGSRELSKTFSGASNLPNVQVNKFSGPHPAGNVGVQIHHIDPINAGEIAWTISPYGVIQIGKLISEGKYDASKIIAVAGQCVKNPQYFNTIAGGSITTYLNDNLNDPSEDVRVISGNVLTGEQVGKESYIGYYDNLITVIPEGRHGDFFGSFVPTKKKLSFHKAIGLFSFLNSPKEEYEVNTNVNGEHRNFVQTGVFEKVVPMDVYPTHLLKAIIAQDYEGMEALGIYEVAEEDFALCEFIDPSKNEVQSIIREGLELLRNS